MRARLIGLALGPFGAQAWRVSRSLLIPLIVLSLSCGGGQRSEASSVRETSPSAPPSSLAIGPASFSFLALIELTAEGRVRANGRDVGTLHADGRLLGPDGAVLAAILPDGVIMIDGTERFRVVGDTLLERDEEVLILRNGALMIEAESVPITGYRPELGRAVLLLSAVTLTAYARAFAH